MQCASIERRTMQQKYATKIVVDELVILSTDSENINNTSEMENNMRVLMDDNLALIKAKDALNSENDWLKRSNTDLHTTVHDIKIATVAVFGIVAQQRLQLDAEHGIAISTLLDENKDLIESNAVMKDELTDMGNRLDALTVDNSALKQEVLDITEQAGQNATAAATALTSAVEKAVKPYWYTKQQQQQQKQKKSVYDYDADGIESFESNDKKAFESIMTSARGRLYGTYEGSDSD
eukprot:21278-Heterococcus_DN1.PRE.2